MTPHKHMLSPSSLLIKNNRGTRQKWLGKKRNHNNCRVGSMSLLNRALVCIHVWVGTYHLTFHLPLWVWVILFDLSSAHCLVTMTFDLSMSNTAKSTVVPLICSREVDLYTITTSLCYLTQSWFTTFSLCLVSMMWETIMAHLWSRSLPVDFSSLSRKLI